jgi:hypothetical protein
MNGADRLSPIFSHLKGLGRRIAAIVAECRDAQRRMTMLAMAPDRYAPRPDTAPDTYAEFMFRTSGALLHEPPAGARRDGSLRTR